MCFMEHRFNQPQSTTTNYSQFSTIASSQLRSTTANRNQLQPITASSQLQSITASSGRRPAIAAI